MFEAMEVSLRIAVVRVASLPMKRLAKSSLSIHPFILSSFLRSAAQPSDVANGNISDVS